MLPRLAHRVTGIVVVLPIVFLILTGLPLQLTEFLALDDASVNWSWVNTSYGITAPDTALTSNGVVQIGDVILANGHVINSHDPLIGAVVIDEVLIVATATELMLASSDFDIPVERINLDWTPSKIGRGSNSSLLVQTKQGVQISDDLGISWESTQPSVPNWANVRRQKSQPDWQHRYTQGKLSWERWLQDLHSGRFFGPIGEWVMSIASLGLLLLSLTGIWLWFRGRDRINGQ